MPRTDWIAVVDPGFPRGGANCLAGYANLLFCNFFAKNCMKKKEFRREGYTYPWHPLDLPLDSDPLQWCDDHRSIAICAIHKSTVRPATIQNVPAPFTAYGGFRNCTRQNHGTAGNHEASGFVNSTVKPILLPIRGLSRYRDGLIWSLRKTFLKLIFQMAALHSRLFNWKLPSNLFGKKTHSVKYQDKPFGGTHTSVVDPSGTPGTRPLLVQILSFSCSFQQKICKKIGWRTGLGNRRTGLGNRRPSSGKVLDPPLNTLLCFKSEQHQYLPESLVH